MPLYFGDKKMSAAYFGSTPVKEIYFGSARIYPEAVLTFWIPESTYHLLDAIGENSLVFTVNGAEQNISISQNFSSYDNDYYYELVCQKGDVITAPEQIFNFSIDNGDPVETINITVEKDTSIDIVGNVLFTAEELPTKIPLEHPGYIPGSGVAADYVDNTAITATAYVKAPTVNNKNSNFAVKGYVEATCQYYYDIDDGGGEVQTGEGETTVSCLSSEFGYTLVSSADGYIRCSGHASVYIGDYELTYATGYVGHNLQVACIITWEELFDHSEDSGEWSIKQDGVTYTYTLTRGESDGYRNKYYITGASSSDSNDESEALYFLYNNSEKLLST